MRQLSEISGERDAMGTLVELTGAFEGIASMRIAQIKNKVQSSEKFFDELWQIYSQIRVDELFHFGRGASAEGVIDKQLILVITSEGGFSGDIDQKLITEMLKSYNSDKDDIAVVGDHGVVQLGQRNIKFVKRYKMPQRDYDINVMPLISLIQGYKNTVVYYQSYKSLMIQEVKSIQLSTAVAERGHSVVKSDETISETNYIFEPSTFDVVDHLERSMMQITLGQVILNSKLAQYASRFRAMSTAREKADESFHDLRLQFNRADRHIKDERLKEVLNGLRKARA